MYLLDTTADTFNYMVLGYAVIFVTIGLFIASLVVRTRNLSREIEMLDEIEAET
jgi:CcmD family protein